jgi:hypothetical protein
MSKHTPGPWTPLGTKATGFSEVVSSVATFEAGHLVCTVNRTFGRGDGTWGRIPREQVDANAYLIAAAPKLLAACKAMLCAMSTEDHRQATWMIMKAVQEAEGLPA